MSETERERGWEKGTKMEKDGVCPLFYGKVSLKTCDATRKLDKKCFFLSLLTVKS